MMGRRYGLLAVLLGVLGGVLGCVSVDHLADTLNKRHITSCIWATGSHGLFVGIHRVTATGNATLADCRDFH